MLSHNASNSASALCTGTVIRGASPARCSSGHCGAAISSRTGVGAYDPWAACTASAVQVPGGPNIT